MNYEETKVSERRFWTRVGIGSLAGITLLVGGCMAGWPQYSVYVERLNGEAILAKSEAARQALVSQAKAERDSATLRAEAIAIVGQASKDYPEYRHQEFIGAFAEALKEGKINSVIYVPTEANIPIIERKRN